MIWLFGSCIMQLVRVQAGRLRYAVIHRQGASIKALKAGKLDEKHRPPRAFLQPRAFLRCFRPFAVDNGVSGMGHDKARDGG
ncbi:hypothetical protein [Stutzerimonas kirkiae]|uniref:hypothetical protein n=1 Tax=Stutzerimonas kirkiae TaxID=2211392 RepID=UPI0010377425|nr:hypothetical protein [Stutzerimonas kirkiae]